MKFETPCCKYVKQFIKWVWAWLPKQFLSTFVLIPAAFAYTIAVVWGWYVADVWVFNPIYFPDLPLKERLFFILLGAVGIGVIAYALNMQFARVNRLDCTIRNAQMSKLAELWLEPEQRIAQDRAAAENRIKVITEEVERDVASRYLSFRTDIARVFVQNRVAPFLPKFSAAEFDILRWLLNILEDYGHIPSVASKYKRDFDISQFHCRGGTKKIAIASRGDESWSSYEILATVTLLEHSLRVAELIIDDIKSKTNTYSIFMPMAILTALSHDIGKIEKTEQIAIEEAVLAQNDHPFISAMMLKQAFPSFHSLADLLAIVEGHHQPISGAENMIFQSLKAADQKARRQEVSEWFIRTFGASAQMPDPYAIIRPDEDDSKGNKGGSGQQPKHNTGGNAAAAAKPQNNTTKTEAAQLPTIADDPQDEGDGYDGKEDNADLNTEMLDDDGNPIEGVSIAYDAPKPTTEVKEVKLTPKKPSKTSKQKLGEMRSLLYSSTGFEPLEFELETYEEAIFKQIKHEPIVIEAVEGFVAGLVIGAIPHEDTLLLSFKRLSRIFRVVMPNLDNELYNGMISYAVQEWRKRKIVLFVSGGYSTKKYEYLYEGNERKIESFVPFSIEGLMLNSDDLNERAKKHPLFELVVGLKMAKG